MLVTSFSGSADLKNQKYSRLNPAVVQIFLSKPDTLGKIIDNDFSILEINENFVIIFSSSEEIKWLEEQNLKPKILYNDYAEMMGWKNNPEILDDFHDYSEMTAELQDIATSYPLIAQLNDLGSSVQGRTIWGLKISDNPDIEENEAEVRICGCHHGNEIMSVELPLMLARYMVDNYEEDSYIKNLVDYRETWIIPMVNPDGREILTRYNANGVDLNRDYGYMWDGEGGSPAPFSQPETRVMRQHALDNNFVLSISFHCSGDIVNYIWNYKGEPVEDNDVVVALSNQYGSHNGYWVVEGYDWYQTKGDTNDFSYGCRGDIDWTIEVQNSNIQQAWDYNRDAMLEIIEAADMGLTGTIVDIDTGLPVVATIWVKESYWPCFTDPKIGDFHKSLMPGSYNITIRANGYQEQTHQIVLSNGSPTVINISLAPEENFYAEQVTLCNFYDPYNWPKNYENNPTEGISSLGPPDSICSSLGKGGYIVLDMGKKGIIKDHEDYVDFKIFEGDGSDDSYEVYVSSNWSGPWKYLGLATGTSEFDLNDFSVEEAQFVKIIDDNDGDPYETNPGADIDALQHIIPSINNPPLITKIKGPDTGKPGIEYEFIFNATDLDGDDVRYFIDWGDKNTKWTGYNPSGTDVKVRHSWSKGGTYNITAKAQDIHGALGPEEKLTVNMPKNKHFNFNFNILEWFFERLPNTFLLLHYLSGL
jgi:hypothetical protein